MTVRESINMRISSWEQMHNEMSRQMLLYLRALLVKCTEEQLNSEWVGPE